MTSVTQNNQALTPEDRDIIRQIIEEVKETHWCQNAFTTTGKGGKIQHCLLGHIEVATAAVSEYKLGRLYRTTDNPRSHTQFWRITTAVDEAIRSSLSIATVRITEWNDTPGRTKEEVVDLLESLL